MLAGWWWDKVLDLLGVLTFVQGHAVEAQAGVLACELEKQSTSRIS